MLRCLLGESPLAGDSLGNYSLESLGATEFVCLIKGTRIPAHNRVMLSILLGLCVFNGVHFRDSYKFVNFARFAMCIGT